MLRELFSNCGGGAYSVVAASGGHSRVVVRGFLVAMASLLLEHGL